MAPIRLAPNARVVPGLSRRIITTICSKITEYFVASLYRSAKQATRRVEQMMRRLRN
jgi:hypothetical protein